MARGLSYREDAGAALALALTAWGTTGLVTGPAIAGTDCGVHLLVVEDAA